MSTEVRLPDLGEGIESGDILSVLVREGDEIAKDQGIVEIETDKATVEVPSSTAGRVAKIHVTPGQTIAVGAVLITLEGAAAATAGAAPSSTPQKNEPSAPSRAPVQSTPPAVSPDPVSPPQAKPEAQPSSQPATADRRQPHPPEPVPPVAPADRETAPPAPSTPQRKTIPAGPAVRRFAREVGVDLEMVAGTGPGGRITRDDVLGVVRQASRAAQSGKTATAAKEKEKESVSTVPGTPSTDAWGPVSVEPLTKIRKTIAAKMHQSWSTVPRVTNFDDADVTELEKIRQASKADYAAAGIRLTSMPFVIKAVTLALRKHPLLNASLDLENNRIVYRRYINIGVAVDTPRGLVVPVLRGADRLSTADVARELAKLAEKSRDNQFTIDDLRGGTFSVSNLGAIGGTYSTPIVNVPEVAILLVGRSRKMPVVVDDQIAIRLMMPVSLSYDHRLIDGATAARFLNDVIYFLEAPGRLLLAP